MESTIAGHGHN